MFLLKSSPINRFYHLTIEEATEDNKISQTLFWRAGERGSRTLLDWCPRPQWRTDWYHRTASCKLDEATGLQSEAPSGVDTCSDHVGQGAENLTTAARLKLLVHCLDLLLRKNLCGDDDTAPIWT
jgi:hypothetical protein